MTRSRPNLCSQVAAMLAVALLSLAGVRSAVMQVQMGAAPASAMPMCDAAAPTAPHGHAPGKATQRTCDVCSVAAHLPVFASAPVVASATTVGWLAWRPVAASGARGPPAFAPRARGPPLASLNV